PGHLLHRRGRGGRGGAGDPGAERRDTQGPEPARGLRPQADAAAAAGARPGRVRWERAPSGTRPCQRARVSPARDGRAAPAAGRYRKGETTRATSPGGDVALVLRGRV